MPDPSPSTMTF